MPVTTCHPAYLDNVRDWEDCRNFFEGERRVKELGPRYLPKPEQSTAKEYHSYVMRAFFFPAMERTVAGLSGAIDRKAPTFKLPDRLSYLEWDTDGDGTDLRNFSKNALNQCFIAGRFGVLIDRPVDGGDVYLSLYIAEDIINWQEDKEKKLQMVVLKETYYERLGTDEFVQQRKTRYRVLRLKDGVYMQELYTPNTAGTSGTGLIYEKTEEIIPSRAGIHMDSIPFIFCNVRTITPAIGKPPLLDLVRKNAEHYRVSADYANALYFTGNPILWVKGVKRPTPKSPVSGDPNDPQFKLTLGSQRAVYLPNQESEIGLTECSGHGVSPNRDKAEDIKKEMAVLGARLLESQRTGVEAAETVYLRQSGEASTLSTIVSTVSAGIRRALEIADVCMGGTGDAIEFELNRDFIDSIIDPQLVSTLADLVSREFISWETFIYNLACGELLPPGVTAEEERQRIETQPPIGNPMADAQALGLLSNIQDQELPEGDNEAN